MSSSDFDYKDYEKSLEKILSMTEKDYWVQYVDVNRHQVNVAKTYLWVAAALMGSYVASYEKYKEVIWSGSNCPLFLLGLSFLVAVIAFGLCLYAIPARKGYKSIANPSWGEFSQQSHNLLKENAENQYIKLLSTLVDRVDSSTYHNVATNQKRAQLLRWTSWILVASFCLALLSGISFGLSKLDISINTTKTETTMSTENNDNSTPQETPTPAASVPNVPTPAGPIGQGTNQPTYTTHSLNPTIGQVRLTESDGGSDGGSDK